MKEIDVRVMRGTAIAVIVLSDTITMSINMVDLVNLDLKTLEAGSRIIFKYRHCSDNEIYSVEEESKEAILSTHKRYAVLYTTLLGIWARSVRR